MKYLLIEMLHRESTLVTRVSMLMKPKATQASSDNVHRPTMIVYTVTGMLIVATIRSENTEKKLPLTVGCTIYL